MRKLLSALICLLLLGSLAVPAFAADLSVPFTDDSLPEVGGKLEVNKYALLDDGSITSEMYNALLEGYVIYSWYKNDMLVLEGTPAADAQIYELTLSDQGCTLYVVVSFYEDNSFQESKKCGEAVSDKILITGPAPEITTTSLPGATVGQAYYTKLVCSDPDAVFSEIMGSQLFEFGMYLTQHGEIEGTPTKAGNCHVNVLAVSEGGGEDSTSFDIAVSPGVGVEITTKNLPEALVGQTYQVTLGCTDRDAIFYIAYDPDNANDFSKTGLTLSEDGIISGTPTMAGSFGFRICASGKGGEDYMVYTLVVQNAPKETTPESTQETTTDATPTKAQHQAHTRDTSDDAEDFPWWGYLLIVLGGIATGIGLAFIFIKLRVRS